MRISKISNITNGIISAPMSPMEASKELLAAFDISPCLIRSIHRIYFDDELTLNESKGSGSITSNDFLIVQISGGIKFFFIARGSDYQPVFIIDGDKAIESPYMKNMNFCPGQIRMN